MFVTLLFSTRFQLKHVDTGLILASQDIYNDLLRDTPFSCDDGMTSVVCACREVAVRPT